MKRSFLVLLLSFAVLLPASAAPAKKKVARAAKAPRAVDRVNKDERIRSDAKTERKDAGGNKPDMPPGQAKKMVKVGPPAERQLKKANGKIFDLRALPRTKPVPRERDERELPDTDPVTLESTTPPGPVTQSLRTPVTLASAPPPNIVFEGLNRELNGAGSPPDTNGDVGPTYYIQSVNSSVGIYRKSDGFQEAAFTFDTLMSQGNFGNQCDNHNFGDPVVLYDTFEDRWILSDFAFTLDGSGNVSPAEAFQCFAVSMTSNPLTGGWNFYSIKNSDGLNDYPKLGIWTDGLYMSSNIFGYPSGAPFQNARVWAFNKAQMYAGSPTVQVVSFDITGGDATVVPSNARLQVGTPPPGRPNLFLGTSFFTNALTIYKFHVDWSRISLSTFTGPDTPATGSAYGTGTYSVPQPGTATQLDSLYPRAMVQNQYTNFSGVESLWIAHSVRRVTSTGFGAPRWYQVNVSGGNVASPTVQTATWDPDGANVMYRWMPSVAVDRGGNMAMGYSTSNASTEFPSMKYAGRLAGDPLNTFSKTEQVLFAGTASQTGSVRWGDYASMSVDPDGCTFWFTTEYANPASQTFDKRWMTKIGSFKYAECTQVGAGGTITGTVTAQSGGAPLAGVTARLGARSATTNASGVYSFSGIPAGTYPTLDARLPGYLPASASSLAVTDGGTTTQNFALTSSPASACLTDTTQADFQTGVATSLDLNSNPGSMSLPNTAIDQQNTAGTTTGTGFGTPAWTGQTFIPAVSGQLVAAEIQLFCSGCGATPPNLTLSVRATSGGLPTGADLASTTVSGALFASGSTTTANTAFASPATLTAGTQYALVLRPVSVPAGSGYFWIRSSPSTYANGSRVLSADNGGTWAADTTRDFNFKTTMRGPYSPTSGNFVSGVKDSNPLSGLTPVWGTLSWNATTPAGTSLQFQVAGSNSPDGPFNFVGPDGTAGTFFTTSPASLTPLYNLRYAKYKAYFSTTNSAVSPSLDDVTMCVNDADCSTTVATITPGSSQVCTGSTGNTASGPAGMTSYAWGITNGTITSGSTSQTVTFTAGASGNVGLTLLVVAPSGCQASNVTSIPIASVATPTASNAGPYCEGETILLSTPTVSGATYAWTGPNGFTSPQQNPTRSTVTAADAGTYSVVVTVNGCSSAAGTTNVVINPTPATPAASNGGPYCDGATIALSTPTVAGATYSWTGPNGFTSPQQNPTRSGVTAADAGTYSVNITVNGCTSAAGTTNVVVTSASTPTASNGGPYCEGGTIALSTPTVAGATYAWTGPNGFTSPLQNPTRSNATPADAGTYSVTVTVNGCTSAAGTTNVVVNPVPATPTASNGGPYCEGATISLSTPTVSGATYAWTGPNGFASPLQNPTRSNATPADAGSYSVTVTVNGCPSAAGSTNVVVNAAPATPTASNGGPYCAGATISLSTPTVSGAAYAWTGPNGFTSILQNPTRSNASLADGGSYSVTVTVNGCTSAAGSTSVVVNAIPATPTASNGGPYCAGSTIALSTPTVAGATYSWSGPNGFTSIFQNPTRSNATTADAGTYSVTVTVNGCPSAAGMTSVVVNAIPATPTITPSGPTTFCTGGSVTLTSSSATGNQWLLNGAPLSGATGQQYVASTAGDYSVVVTANSCSSAPSATTTVTINPKPNATISAPSSVVATSTGNVATVANAGAGATYAWSATNGTITAGNNTPSITFTAGAAGNLTLQVTVTTGAGCSDTKSANVTVTAAPTPVTITSVVPPAGKTTGGKDVTINGTGFQSGATVTFGGSAATSVVVVNATKITAKTPAHAAGAVNVVVTNLDSSTGTRTNGYTYVSTQFDANGDGVIDPADIFYLVNYLYLAGPPPAGPAGMPSGDANNDSVVDPADIFYVVNYLFMNGPAPAATTPKVSSQSASAPLSGAVTLGKPVLRGDRYVIPVTVTAAPGSSVPQALSLRVVFGGDATGATIRRTAAGQPAFEITRTSANALTYLLAFDPSAGNVAGAVAEIELDARGGAPLRVDLDPALTLLSDQGGTSKATVAAGTLRLSGTTTDDSRLQPKTRLE